LSNDWTWDHIMDDVKNELELLLLYSVARR
jgi:hypothetical protein